MSKIGVSTIILIGLFLLPAASQERKVPNSMISHPENYIKITDWSFYAAFRTAIIHHVTIENNSEIAYKNIRVRIRYYSTSASNYGTQVSQEKGILPVTLPPRSKGTYLQGGSVFGAGSGLSYADNLEVLGAIPILDE